jgi:hypothetical protein
LFTVLQHTLPTHIRPSAGAPIRVRPSKTSRFLPRCEISPPNEDPRRSLLTRARPTHAQHPTRNHLLSDTVLLSPVGSFATTPSIRPSSPFPSAKFLRTDPQVTRTIVFLAPGGTQRHRGAHAYESSLTPISSQRTEFPPFSRLDVDYTTRIHSPAHDRVYPTQPACSHPPFDWRPPGCSRPPVYPHRPVYSHSSAYSRQELTCTRRFRRPRKLTHIRQFTHTHRALHLVKPHRPIRDNTPLGVWPVARVFSRIIRDVICIR